MKLQRKNMTTRCAVREAQTLHRSKHAFIVRLVHIFHTESLYCLLMELCEKDLNTCIIACETQSGVAEGLPDRQVARYSACVMLALEYLHEHKTIFQDLKPENVLVTSHEKGDHAKLTDFGLARCVDSFIARSGGSFATEADEESGAHMDIPTPSSITAGTPGFMASEVLRGRPEARSAEVWLWWLAGRDWYALGCCMLLMILGERGGRKVCLQQRNVLMPPPVDDIGQTLRRAVQERRIENDAFHLVAALTACSVAQRARSKEMRESAYLQDAISELEATVATYARSQATSKSVQNTDPSLRGSKAGAWWQIWNRRSIPEPA